VNTVDTILPTSHGNLVDTTVELCNFEIPMDFAGTKPMTCLVTNGTVIFAQINANYGLIGNSVGSGPDGYFDLNGATDPRSNVFIDGTPQQVEHTPGTEGTWWFVVRNGSTLTYDLNIVAGTANVAPV
jgi:hypothetical protein